MTHLLPTFARSLARCVLNVEVALHQRTSCLLGYSWASRSFRTSSPAADASADTNSSAERLLDIFSKNTKLQEMMMMSLPAPMRSPDAIKAMLASPSARKMIADMITKQGLKIPEQMLDSMSTNNMDAAFERANRLGINPAEVFHRLMGHPGLIQRLQAAPQAMQALMEVSQNPASASKYSQEVMEVGDRSIGMPGVFATQEKAVAAIVLKVVSTVQDILTESATKKPQAGSDASVIQMAPGEDTSPASAPATSTTSMSMSSSDPGDPGASTPPSPPPPPPPGTPPAPAAAAAAAAGAQPASGSNPAQMMQAYISMMSGDPQLAAKLQDPRIQAALQEVAQSPWKTIKYIFDRDIMAVFKGLQQVMSGKKL